MRTSVGAAKALWICLCLPACRLGFKSQAHHLCFIIYSQICANFVQTNAFTGVANAHGSSPQPTACSRSPSSGNYYVPIPIVGIEPRSSYSNFLILQQTPYFSYHNVRQTFSSCVMNQNPTREPFLRSMISPNDAIQSRHLVPVS